MHLVEGSSEMRFKVTHWKLGRATLMGTLHFIGRSWRAWKDRGYSRRIKDDLGPDAKPDGAFWWGIITSSSSWSSSPPFGNDGNRYGLLSTILFAQITGRESKLDVTVQGSVEKWGGRNRAGEGDHGNDTTLSPVTSQTPCAHDLFTCRDGFWVPSSRNIFNAWM